MYSFISSAAQHLITALNTTISFLPHPLQVTEGCSLKGVPLTWGVFTSEKLPGEGGWYDRECEVSSFPITPLYILSLLVDFGVRTREAESQQWSSFVLKIPAVTDLRKQKMTCSCKPPQQTRSRWTDGWKYGEIWDIWVTLSKQSNGQHGASIYKF